MVVYFLNPILKPVVFRKVSSWVYRSLLENGTDWDKACECLEFSKLDVVLKTFEEEGDLTVEGPTQVEMAELHWRYEIPARLPSRLSFLLELRGKYGFVRLPETSPFIATIELPK